MPVDPEKREKMRRKAEYRRNRRKALNKLREDYKDDPDLTELMQTYEIAKQMLASAREAQREARSALHTAEVQLDEKLIPYLPAELAEPNLPE